MGVNHTPLYVSMHIVLLYISWPAGDVTGKLKMYSLHYWTFKETNIFAYTDNECLLEPRGAECKWLESRLFWLSESGRDPVSSSEKSHQFLNHHYTFQLILDADKIIAYKVFLLKQKQSDGAVLPKWQTSHSVYKMLLSYGKNHSQEAKRRMSGVNSVDRRHVSMLFSLVTLTVLYCTVPVGCVV